MRYFPQQGDTLIPIGFNRSADESGVCSVDLTDPAAAGSCIKKEQPEVIIHLAGNKDVLKCEADKEISRRINYGISRNIAGECLRQRVKLVYISTDYVFDGFNGPFDELSRPAPKTQYGKDKLSAEEFIRKELPDYAIVRTAGIFGLKNDFVENVIRHVQHKAVFHAYANLKNSPTFIRDFSLMLYAIINKGLKGIFHCAGPESLSRYDFALKICKVFKFEKGLIAPADLDLAKDIRPPDLSMDCSRTYKSLGYYPEGIEADLESYSSIWEG